MRDCAELNTAIATTVLDTDLKAYSTGCCLMVALVACCGPVTLLAEVICLPCTYQTGVCTAEVDTAVTTAYRADCMHHAVLHLMQSTVESNL